MSWSDVYGRIFSAQARRTLLTVCAAVLVLLVLPASSAAQGTGTLTGLVTHATTGRGLGAAQVFVVGTQIGSLARGDGRYLILNVPAGTHQVQVILVGYPTETQEVTVQAGQSAVADFALTPRAIDMDEIIVTGTAGAVGRREVGNSISAINAEDVRGRAIKTMDDVLAASATGLDILYTGGDAGSGATIRIRGVNSITQENEPLIYVDGIRVYSGHYIPPKSGPLPGLTTASTPGQRSSPLNDINPEDVARVEVIKGAAATTLYGTEAAGGVIQIFTKSGAGVQQGVTVWDAKITQGMSRLPSQWGPNGRPSEAWFNAYGPESEGIFLDQWLDRGYFQEYSLSARGRREELTYFLSGRWLSDEGVLPSDQQSREWTVRANTSFSPTPAITIGFNNHLSRRRVDWIANGGEAEGFMVNVLRGSRDYTEDRDELVLELDFDDYQTHWISGIHFGYQPTTALEMRAAVGFDYVEQEHIADTPFGSWFVPRGERGLAGFRTETKTIDFRTTYRADVAGVGTNTSVGFAVFDNLVRHTHGLATTFAGPQEPTLTSGAVRQVVENRLREVNAGFFVQEVLGFADKLYLTAGLRVDGNSAFGNDFGLQTYPKLSASYIISDEDFWPDALEVAKLRVAFGESGKAPGFFDAERVWAPIQTKEGQPGVSPRNLGNAALGPERTRELEAGFEMSAWDGRVGLDFSYYSQRTLDALVPATLDPSLGFQGSQLLNIGTIDNKGIEVALDTEPVRTRDLSWQLSLGLSTNKSEVVDLGGAAPIQIGGRIWAREGYPLASYFDVQVTNPDEIAEPVYAMDPDPTFGRNVFIGPVFPEFNWTISSALRIGDNLQISARGEFKGGQVMFSRTAEANTQRNTWPACYDIQQRMAAGDLSDVTALQRSRCKARPDRGTLTTRADFFRLRSLAVSYDLPESLVPASLSSLAVHVAATNLFKITDYWGLDPETWNTAGEPQLTRNENYLLPPVQRFDFSLRMSF
jgi:outer membrane cobalamin receptor